VLLRLGRLAALAEGAAALARRSARAAEGMLSPKASRRFDAPALAAMSRVNAREVALEVASEGVRWVVGADGGEGADVLAGRLGVPAVQAAQAGLVTDMDRVADHVYGRA
jgi:hypothetical protein